MANLSIHHISSRLCVQTRQCHVHISGTYTTVGAAEVAVGNTWVEKAQKMSSYKRARQGPKETFCGGATLSPSNFHCKHLVYIAAFICRKSLAFPKATRPLTQQLIAVISWWSPVWVKTLRWEICCGLKTGRRNLVDFSRWVRLVQVLCILHEVPCWVYQIERLSWNALPPDIRAVGTWKHSDKPPKLTIVVWHLLYFDGFISSASYLCDYWNASVFNL